MIFIIKNEYVPFILVVIVTVPVQKLNFYAVPSLNLSNDYYYLIIIIQKMLLCYFVSLVLINEISTTDTNDSPSIEGVTETINCSVNSVGK